MTIISANKTRNGLESWMMMIGKAVVRASQKVCWVSDDVERLPRFRFGEPFFYNREFNLRIKALILCKLLILTLSLILFSFWRKGGQIALLETIRNPWKTHDSTRQKRSYRVKETELTKISRLLRFSTQTTKPHCRTTPTIPSRLLWPHPSNTMKAIPRTQTT